MPRSLLLVCLMLGVLGCGARAEVAKEKALAKIDSLLGEMDVKRKEIEHSVAALKDGINGIRKAKIKAQVKRDQIGRQVAPIVEKIEATDTTLKKLRDYLATEEPVEIAATTYSQAELNEMAGKVIQARKDLAERRDGLQRAQESLDKVVTTLERKQHGYQQQLSRLEGRIAEIDAKRTALKAMQDASAEMGGGDGNFAVKVAQLEEDVNDLYVDVEAGLLTEDEKWNEQAVTEQIDSVDAFISATQDPTDRIAEIDALLGGGQ